MEHRRLGRLALKVSPLCLGTMNFGYVTEEPDSHAIMDRALELGIDFFDTADLYGSYGAHGLTEEIIGRWFALGEGRRERVVIATKCYYKTGAGPNDRGLSARHIREACDGSLRRLQVDHIDLYQMHHVDRDAPWEEILQAMEALVNQGKILYVGSSNLAGWHIAQANETARRKGSLGLASEQCCYSLSQRSVEMEVLPACQAYDMGVLPWSPLDGGLLAGSRTLPSGGRRADEADRIEAYRPQLDRYEALCNELGATPAHVALAWLLSNPIVTAPVVGPRTAEQLDGLVPSTELELSPEILGRLDEIFPGPGVAPESWAD
jgi:aryl-alcohol dehydrogenase-like predicted oxidoreductase